MVIRALVHEIEGTACRYRRCGRPSAFFDVQSELSSHLHRSSTMWARFHSLCLVLGYPVASTLVAAPFFLRDPNGSLSLSAMTIRVRTFVARTAASASRPAEAVTPCRRAKRGGTVRSCRSLSRATVTGGVRAISPRFRLHGFRCRPRQGNTAARPRFRRHVVGTCALDAL